MVTSKGRSIVSRLKTFLDELKVYQAYRTISRKRNLKQQEYREMMSLREKLVRKASGFRSSITELTGKEKVTVTPKTGPQYFYDIWFTGLGSQFDSRAYRAIGRCIDVTIAAIGKLESDIEMGIRDKQGNIIGEPPKDTAELPVNLFDKMQFHPRVIQVSESLFKTGNYASAILEAFKAVDNYVKEKTALSLNGQALMSKVFDENAPIIKLNDLLTQSDRDEQEGFKFLFKGATIGIRNPKAHDNVVQTDPYRTIEYLGLASLLMKRIEEGKLVKLLR